MWTKAWELIAENEHYLGMQLYKECIKTNFNDC